MGGRKGYSLRRVVGDLRKVGGEKKRLLQGIKEHDVDKAVTASAKLLAGSDEALDSVVHAFLFVRSIDKKTRKQLSEKNTRERRLGLAEQWSSYRTKAGVHFSPEINRSVVDTATRALRRKE
jgi:hypothetical protein